MNEIESKRKSKETRGHCALCQREQWLTFHHLIPRACHKRGWFQRHFSKEDMQSRGIDICRTCHSFIHKLYDEKQLGQCFNTIDALLKDEKIQHFLHWAKRQR